MQKHWENPDKPTSGHLNVRPGPDRHQRAILRSLSDNISLNAVVNSSGKLLPQSAKGWALVLRLHFFRKLCRWVRGLEGLQRRSFYHGQQNCHAIA